MKASKMFLYALHCPEISLDETSEILTFIREHEDILGASLEDLRISQLDLEGMKKDFISIGGTKL